MIKELFGRQVRYEPNLENYTVNLFIVKVSSYGDNLDRDISKHTLK